MRVCVCVCGGGGGGGYWISTAYWQFSLYLASYLLVLLMKEPVFEKLLHKDVKVTENVYPLNLISMLKSKFLISYFYPLSFNFNADFQNISAEISFTPFYLVLCVNVQTDLFHTSCWRHVWVRFQGSQVQTPAQPCTILGDWSWNNYCGHSPPSSDSRRKVVSYW